MTFRGTIVNGRVELDGGASLPDGTRVRVEPVAGARAKARSGGPGLRSLAKHAVKTGIKDLAAQHDHYVYGTPKRAPAKRGPSKRSRR